MSVCVVLPFLAASIKKVDVEMIHVAVHVGSNLAKSTKIS